MSRLFHAVNRLVGMLIVIGIPAALAWLYWIGFGDGIRTDVARAIGGSTFRVNIARLRLNPFEGIEANGVTIYQQANGGRRIADVDKLVVSLGLADLLHGKIAIDLLRLERATVSVPFADDGNKPDVIELADLRANILNGDGRLTISSAEFDLHGIHVSVTGQLLNPESGAISSPSTPENPGARVAAIRSALRVLDELEFRGARPVLTLEVAGDVSNPSTLGVPTIDLHGGGISWRDFSVDHVAARASYASRNLNVTRLTAAGRSGDVQVSGSWNFQAGAGEAWLSGHFAVDPILQVLEKSELSKTLVFDRAPGVDAHVTVTSEKDMLATGRISSGPFRFRDVSVRNVEAAFAWSGEKLYVQDAVVQAKSGTVRGSLLRTGEGVRVKIDSDAIPTEFTSIFGPNERRILDLMEFDDAPEVNMELSGPRLSMDALSGSGEIRLGRTAMRGSWIDSATSNVELKDRAVLYRNFDVRKGDHRARGSFTYDFGRREVRLDDIHSDLNPPDVLMWVDPRIAATVAVYRFHEPPSVVADGLVHMKDPSKNDLKIAVNAPDGLDYELLNRDLSFGATTADVTLEGRTVLADVRNAKLMGGDVSVDANVSTDPDDPSFGALVKIRGIDFPELTDLYFGYSRSEGRMSGDYRFTAKLRDAGSMKGEGSIRVEEGHVLSIPLFGPLSEIMSAVIPGVGHESARLATAGFTVGDGKVFTKNLDIQGQGFEMFGDGSIAYPSGALDLSVRINARGIPGIVLFPVSKLFEYVSTGTMSDPQWRPKIVPREFFDILGMGGNPKPSKKSSSVP